MELKNPLYKNIGIHVILSLFTVDKGIVKVLLIKRKNEPHCGKWALIGGALYNNEELITGMKREIDEKTGIKEDIDIHFSSVIDDIERSNLQRMIAITYIGIINIDRVKFLKDTLKTSDANWFDIKEVPELAYDHNKVLETNLRTLQEKIVESNILKSLYPNGFTLPEIQKAYETILNKKFDRRNFRRKILSFDFIKDTNEERIFEGNKPAKLYKFDKKHKKNKTIF
jgi:8-oxo-dGTP diphosphatase